MKARPPSVAFWRAARIAADVVAGLASLTVAFLARIHLELPFTASVLPAERLALIGLAGLLVVTTQGPLLYFFGFYEVHRPIHRAERLRRLALFGTLQGLVLMGFYFLSAQEFPRTVVLLFAPLNLGMLQLLRAALDRLVPASRRRVAIVGRGPRANELAESIDRHRAEAVWVVGHVDSPDDPPGVPGPGPHLGSVEDLPDLIARGAIDDIIMTSEVDTWQTALIDRLARRPDARTAILLLPGPFEALLGRMRYRSIQDIPFIEVVRETEWHTPRLSKRLFDLTLALPLLLLAAPVIVACGALVRLTSHGPALYSQVRVGRDRRPFVLRKLRTMTADAEDDGEEVLARHADPRATRIGAILRRLRLDELPQLLQVVAGTISLVGPRPERPGFVERYLAEVPGYAARFSIPPGLTGLAQVSGDYHTSPENKLRYDLAYLANWSVWLDLTILLRTVRIVLTSRGV